MIRLLCLLVLVGLACCKKDSGIDEPDLSGIVIEKVSYTTAVLRAELSHRGPTPVAEKGFCWSSQHQLPDIDSSSKLVTQQTGLQFTDTIKGLRYNTKYYVRAFARTAKGIIYSQIDSFTTANSSYTFGQAFGGGYVFYIDSTGEHGLVAARTYGHEYWGEWWTRFEFMGTRKEVGTGNANTELLIARAGAEAYAAKYCYDLEFEGYDDWFMPSVDELYLLKANLGPTGRLGIYPGDIYWSSSEVSFPGYEYAAWFVMINGIASFTSDDKQYDHGVIPVRAF